ncbi:MAG: ABC transporter permease [Bacteroidota bacterium]
MKKEQTPPPRFPFKLLKWFCKPEYHSDIEGDLLETYYRRQADWGRQAANSFLYQEVLLLFRPELIHYTLPNFPMNYQSLLHNHLKVTWRNLRRKKAASLLEIAGLGLGLACCLGVFLWVASELSFDEFHSKKDNIFMVELLLDGWEESVVTPAPLASSLASEFPEVIRASRYSYFHDGMLMKVGDQQLFEKGAKVDSSFFSMFDFSFKEGNSINFEGNKIILTESIANKYFPNQNPIGEILTLNQEEPHMVSAVLEDMPQNSSFQFDFVIPFEPITEQKWGAWFCATLIQLDESVDPEQFLSSTNSLKIFYDTINKPKWSSRLIALSDFYFHNKMRPFFPQSGNMNLIWLFTIAGIVILVLSCLNYVSLTTARFVTHFRQIGLEKLLGAGYWQASHKYFVEAFLHTSFALIIAGLLLIFFQRYYDGFDLLNLTETLHLNYIIWVILGVSLSMVFFNTVLPALTLKTISPMALLRNNKEHTLSSSSLRRGLVILQFCVSISMIISLLIFQQQLTFIQEKELGYSKDHVLSIQLNDQVTASFPTFRNKLQQHSNILNVSQSSFEYVYFDMKISDWEGKSSEEPITVRPMTADEEFTKTLDIVMVEGRFYDGRLTEDESLVINQAAARMLGWDEAIGKKVRLPGEEEDRTIIGVTKDFHYWGLTEAIDPLFIVYGSSGNVYVSIREGTENETVAYIEKAYKEVNPSYPIDYILLADRYQNEHAAYYQAGKLFRIFGIVAVIISCISLLAMINFTVERKAKEVGIRKVHGASFWNIIHLLQKGFILYVLLAFAFSVPITWLVMSHWLQIFAYKTAFSVNQFLLGGSVVLIAAIFTTLFHATRAALANPIHALRDE